jgi:hypothetical protein
MDKTCCYKHGCPVARHENRLVAVAGEGGTNGKLSEMQKDIEENRAHIRENRRDLWAIKLLIAKWAGGGAGVAVGVVELIKRVT